MKLDPTKLKKNQLIWWSAERYMSVWSCPGIIVYNDSERELIVIMTLDNMQEYTTSWTHLEQALLKEIRLASVREVTDYINNQILLKKQNILTLDAEIAMIENSVKNYTKLLDKGITL